MRGHSLAKSVSRLHEELPEADTALCLFLGACDGPRDRNVLRHGRRGVIHDLMMEVCRQSLLRAEDIEFDASLHLVRQIVRSGCLRLGSRRGREAHVVLESDCLRGSDTHPATNSRQGIGAIDLQGVRLVIPIAKVDAHHLVMFVGPVGAVYHYGWLLKAVAVKKLERVALGDHHRSKIVSADVLIQIIHRVVGAS